MAFSLNQIGPFQFIRLDGVPQLPREESDVLSRPGVNGVGFVKTGRKGKPFSLRSVVDVATWAAANNANVAYHALTNSALIDVIFGGVNYGAASIKFNVLDVEVTDIRAVTVPAGGLVSGLAIVSATWQLVAVKV